SGSPRRSGARRRSALGGRTEGAGSVVGLGVGEPAEELRVEHLRTFLVREVSRPVDELPAVRGGHVAAGALGAPWEGARVEGTVQLECGHLDGGAHTVRVADPVRADERPYEPAVVLQRAVRGPRDLYGLPHELLC